MGCTRLASVTIGAGVTRVLIGAFGDCTSLISVTFQGTIASSDFDNRAFPGDLREKFYTSNKTNGTPGMYTRPNGSSNAWTILDSGAVQAKVQYDQGREYLNKRDYDRAIAAFTEAIRLNPNYIDAFSRRGYAYFGKGDYDKAISDYTQAIRLDPNNEDNYFSRSQVFMGKNNYDQAIADLNQVIRLNPNSWSNYYSRGIAYELKGNYDQAIADYTQIIRLSPNFYAYCARGDVYYKKGDYDKAILDYEKALQLEPNDPEIKQSLEQARRQRER